MTFDLCEGKIQGENFQVKLPLKYSYVLVNETNEYKYWGIWSISAKIYPPKVNACQAKHHEIFFLKQ